MRLIIPEDWMWRHDWIMFLLFPLCIVGVLAQALAGVGAMGGMMAMVVAIVGMPIRAWRVRRGVWFFAIIFATLLVAIYVELNLQPLHTRRSNPGIALMIDDTVMLLVLSYGVRYLASVAWHSWCRDST